VIVLRDYQQQLYADIHAEWGKGARNVLAVAPTGSGKTSTFAKVIHDHPGASIAIAHRNELVSQISLTLARNGVRHRIIGSHTAVRACVGLHVGELGRSYFDQDAAHGVAGVDTLVKRPPDDPWFRRVSLWVQDECFVAGTLVDGKPIESIRVGDTVTAFNEAAGEFEQRNVTQLFRNPAPKKMVRLETKEHHVLYCTLGHPFWTKRGWVPAGELTEHDEVLTYAMHSMWRANPANERSAAVPLSENWQHLLHEEVRDGVPRDSAHPRVVFSCARRAGKSYLLNLWKTGRPGGTSGGAVPQNGASILQPSVFGQVPGTTLLGDRDLDEQKVRLGPHDCEQPNAENGDARQSQPCPESGRAPAHFSWRK